MNCAGDKFGWIEPEGKAYQIAANNLTQLREEIHQVCYLARQGGVLDGGAMLSAASRERGFVMTGLEKRRGIV